MQLSVEDLTPAIGSVVHGINLGVEMQDSDAQQLRTLLHSRKVIFFRNQSLAPNDLLSLASVFGSPVASPHPKFGCVDGIEEVSLVVNDAENPPDINVWHSDLSYYEQPATSCVLHCQQCPATGGDTLWASMVEAYNTLSDTLKQVVDSHQAYHQLPLDGYPPEMIKKALRKPVAAIHPMVRRIPETGERALYVNRVYAHRIEGMSKQESDGILNALFTHAESPDYQVRFKWGMRDVAIWDNRSTQHFAVADYFPEVRAMHRVALAGEPVISAS